MHAALRTAFLNRAELRAALFVDAQPHLHRWRMNVTPAQAGAQFLTPKPHTHSSHGHH